MSFCFVRVEDFFGILGAVFLFSGWFDVVIWLKLIDANRRELLMLRSSGGFLGEVDGSGRVVGVVEFWCYFLGVFVCSGCGRGRECC